MRSEPVLRDSWNGAGGIHDGLFETRLDHVPAEDPLGADESTESGHFDGHTGRYLLASNEIDERADEDDTNETPEDTVAPFHGIDEFEVIKRCGRV